MMQHAFAIIALAGMAVAVPLRANIAVPLRANPYTIMELVGGSQELSTLVGALEAADLVEALSGAGPFTVFAPTNAAFANLPRGVLDDLLNPANKAELVRALTYHVAAGNFSAADLKNDKTIQTLEGANVTVRISGSNIFINGAAKVVMADVEASNGVVHVIDAVLVYNVPPDLSLDALNAEADKTIVELAVATPELSTLVAALKAADLVDALSDAGPFTVAAPTNAAFANLPAGVLHALLKPANKAVLVKVLLYHVAAGNFQAADLKNDETIETLEGASVTARISGSEISIQGGFAANLAKVVTADVEASNGVVHVVDAVLVPPGLSLVALVAGSYDMR